MSARLASFRLAINIDSPARRRYLISGATVCFVVLVAIQFSHTKASSPLDFLPSLVLALAPILAYLFARWPLIFPYCAYILFLPFESLSRIGSAGTIAKFLGIMCVIAILARVIRQRSRVLPPRALAAWLCLLFWMVITAFWALNQNDAFTALAMYAGVMGLFAVLSFFRPTKIEFYAMLISIVVAGIVSAGYDAYLFHSGQNVIKSASRVMLIVGDSRIDPNAWAASLILPIAIALHWLFNARTFVARAAMVPALGVLFAGLAASGSRGGMFAVLTVFVLLAARSRHRLKVCSVLAASIVVALLANPGLIVRFQSAQADGGAGRADIWRIGLHAFSNRWLSGAGVGNFPTAYDEEYLLVATRHALEWHVSPHNVALGVATELGVIGLILWLVCLYYQMKVVSVVSKRHEFYELRLAFEGAFLGSIISSLSVANLNAKYVWLTFGTMVILRGYALPQRTPIAAQRLTSVRRSKIAPNSGTELSTGAT